MTGTYEPRQVREEAAVTKKACVVAESISSLPAVATSLSWFQQGCTAKDPKNTLHPYISFTVNTYSSPFSINMLNPNSLLWVRDEISYFQYPKLSSIQYLSHAVFTRNGGVSAKPFEGLNSSYMVGDRQENVTSNLSKIIDTIGAGRLMFMNQIHGDDVLVVRQGLVAKQGLVPSVDAVITNVPGVAILVKQADCQGVIIFDPDKKIVANVHCGWRGNVLNILKRVVVKMQQEFGCRSSDMLAAIGPSLGPCCAEFVGHERLFPKEFRKFMVRENYFDLWAVSCWQLLEAGLREENIEVAGICSCCRTDLFYSYRGEGLTGRFGTVAILR